MEYERHIANFFINSSKSFKAETCPVCRILTVNIADTCRKEINAEISMARKERKE